MRRKLRKFFGLIAVVLSEMFSFIERTLNMVKHIRFTIPVLLRKCSVAVRTFALQFIDLDSISSLSHNKELENGICCFPAWHSREKDTVGKKPLSLLVVSLGKTINGIPPPLLGRQVISRAVHPS